MNPPKDPELIAFCETLMKTPDLEREPLWIRLTEEILPSITDPDDREYAMSVAMFQGSIIRDRYEGLHIRFEERLRRWAIKNGLL